MPAGAAAPAFTTHTNADKNTLNAGNAECMLSLPGVHGILKGAFK